MIIVSQQFHDEPEHGGRRALSDGEAGLTLIEMIVVLAIIALVLATAPMKPA